jgi:hypothetical protein
MRRLGQYQAPAVLELCDATPEDDTAEDLVKGGVRLPSGKLLDVSDSSVRDKKEAVKEIRDSGGKTSGNGGAKGGTTTSAEDRRVAAEAEAALHAVGLKRARVWAVARPGR